jgi:hypothetical protein
MNLDEQEINRSQVIDDQAMSSSCPVKMLLKIEIKRKKELLAEKPVKVGEISRKG